MSKNKNEIPKEDVKLINNAFADTQDASVIGKTASGMITKAKNTILNSQGHVIVDYRGRTLKHGKAVYRDGKYVIVARAGEAFDKVPMDVRDMVQWNESDFIN